MVCRGSNLVCSAWSRVGRPVLGQRPGVTPGEVDSDGFDSVCGDSVEADSVEDWSLLAVGEAAEPDEVGEDDSVGEDEAVSDGDGLVLGGSSLGVLVGDGVGEPVGAGVVVEVDPGSADPDDAPSVGAGLSVESCELPGWGACWEAGFGSGSASCWPVPSWRAGSWSVLSDAPASCARESAFWRVPLPSALLSGGCWSDFFSSDFFSSDFCLSCFCLPEVVLGLP